MKSEKQRLHLEKLAKLRKGKHHSTSAKRKISELRKKRIGNKSSNWRGGRILVDGYWYIYSPDHPNKTKDNYVVEHRLVMEEKLGRFLHKKEIVHHLNGIKTDNAIENLVICLSLGHHTSEYHVKRNSLGQFCSD